MAVAFSNNKVFCLYKLLPVRVFIPGIPPAAAWRRRREDSVLRATAHSSAFGVEGHMAVELREEFLIAVSFG